MFAFFGKNDPLREHFQNSAPKGFTASPIDVVCSNFVKFGNGKSIKPCDIYLTEKKQNFALLSSSRYCADIA